ncbi:MAG TPA: hypothetical protein VNY84_08690 [Acidimicrobiales bacterium]|nr:hypothetical protein [Acidimicrobiales bacterium]
MLPASVGLPVSGGIVASGVVVAPDPVIVPEGPAVPLPAAADAPAPVAVAPADVPVVGELAPLDCATPDDEDAQATWANSPAAGTRTLRRRRRCIAVPRAGWGTRLKRVAKES